MRYSLPRLPYANKDVLRIGSPDPLPVGRAHVVYEAASTRRIRCCEPDGRCR